MQKATLIRNTPATIRTFECAGLVPKEVLANLLNGVQDHQTGNITLKALVAGKTLQLKTLREQEAQDHRRDVQRTARKGRKSRGHSR